ncbi:hypothetical protein AB6E04_00825 [Vibrio amylolyticus]
MTKSKAPMTPEAAARIKSSNAKSGDGKTAKGSFPARAESAATKNSNSNK